MGSFRGFLEEFGSANPPRMRFEGGSADELARWQGRFLGKLEDLSGTALPVRRRSRGDAPAARRVELLSRQEHADHIREHVAIESVLGATVTALVLVPKAGPGGRRPGVLAFHGHTEAGKSAVAGVSPTGQPGYGLAAARAGFTVLCPDWWGWGERAEAGFDFEGQDVCNTKFVAAGMYGIPLLNLMIHDAQAVADVLLARPDVDPTRVAAVGNSFGGRMSMYLAAFDERVRCAVCSGCLNCFRERSLKMTSCGAQFFPGMLQWGDVQDVFALIAPRPLMIMTGRADPLLPAEWTARMKPTIERAYRSAGAADNLTFFDHDGGHVLPAEPMIRWLTERFRTA